MGAAGQDKAKQRIRALDLIQKHAGPNAVQLQQQLADMRAQTSSTIQQLGSQVQALQARVRDQEVALASTAYALETAQVQYSSMQESLRCAEDAAAVAASECVSLVGVVQRLLDQEARVRSAQATRAHQLRESLLHTHAALRRAADKDRSCQDERAVWLRERETALTAERTALLEQQAVHTARDEALEMLQLKYHLSVLKIKELLQDASQQAGSAVAAVTSGVQKLPDKAGAHQPPPGPGQSHLKQQQ